MARTVWLAAGAALITLSLSTGSTQDKAGNAKLAWQAQGTLYEACSCAVPCPCNFGQPPSSGSCHTVYVYQLKNAYFGKVKLDGLAFGGGEADKGAMGFLDARANTEQRAALRKLAAAVFAKGGASTGQRTFTFDNIQTESKDNAFKVRLGKAGGFDADVLIGADRKNPIIVENNTTWPVKRFMKGKTTKFDYSDSLGNVLKYDGVNANLGEFDLQP